MNCPFAVSASLPVVNGRPRWLILDGQVGSRNPSSTLLNKVAPICIWSLFSIFVKLWDENLETKRYYSSSRVYLPSYSACKCADGLRFAVCVVLCNGNQQFVDSSFKDQQEQTLLSFLSDFLQVNDWYWPYGITVAHCELCIKCNFPVHCGQVWLCCVQYPSSEGSQYCQRHS